jgi:hypothetical protein
LRKRIMEVGYQEESHGDHRRPLAKAWRDFRLSHADDTTTAGLPRQAGWRHLRCEKCHIAHPLDIIGWKDCAELTPIARHRAPPKELADETRYLWDRLKLPFWPQENCSCPRRNALRSKATRRIL